MADDQFPHCRRPERSRPRSESLLQGPGGDGGVNRGHEADRLRYHNWEDFRSPQLIRSLEEGDNPTDCTLGVTGDLVFPNHQHLPAVSSESSYNFSVTQSILPYFLFPEVG